MAISGKNYRDEPHCRYCGGEKPDQIAEFSTWEGIRGEWLIYKYDGSVKRGYQVVSGAWGDPVWQVQRLTDLKSGLVVEIHD